jgi:hypothetical protein
MHERCPVCDLQFEREPGYFLALRPLLTRRVVLRFYVNQTRMDARVKTVREILHSGDQYLIPFFQIGVDPDFETTS